MKLLNNGGEIFEGTEWECLDYAGREYPLNDEQFTELRDGGTYCGGNFLELSDETE